MKKPLALIAALLVLAPALALAPRAAAGKIYWTNAQDRRDRARQPERHARGPSFIGGAETLFDVAVDRRARLLDHRRRRPGGIGRANLNGGALDLGFITGAGFPGGSRSTMRTSTGRATATTRSDAPTSTARASTRASSPRAAQPRRGGGRLRARLLDHTWHWRSGAPTSTARGWRSASSPARGPLLAGGRAPGTSTGPTATRSGAPSSNGTHVDTGFITRAGHPCGVAVSARHVYWTSSGEPGGSGAPG